MRIDCPKEANNNENRVGLTTNAVRAYVKLWFTACKRGIGKSLQRKYCIESRLEYI
jgi:alanine dehydrogenase